MSLNNFVYVDYSSLGYGSRVALFPKGSPSDTVVNPRGKIGKIGVTAHSSISHFFHRTVTLSVEGQEGKSKQFYLNRSSLIKWMNAQSDDSNQVPKTETDDALKRRLGSFKKTKSAGEETLNRQDPNSLIGKIRALFCRLVLSVAPSSWGLFKAKIKLFTLSESYLQTCSESLACCAFREGVDRVSAYKDFVKDKTPAHFCDIPPTDKDNYIKKYKKEPGERALYVDGQIPPGTKVDTSTGTSGTPTSWYRGPQEIEAINRSIRFGAKVVLGDQPYYLINGFALGQWATGITIANAAAADPNAIVCNIGMNIQLIVDAIERAITTHPQYPIIVAGYPPHLCEVVREAERRKVKLHEHRIIGMVGGESMSEGLRERMLYQSDAMEEVTSYKTGFQECYSAYGASDLDINIGYETAFAVELRQKLHEHPTLAKEMLGESAFIPMVFPYSPLNYHIESDAEQCLIYTCVRGDRISPRIRYNLGDRGKVMPCSDVLALLKKHGVTLKHTPRVPLPLLFVWGRIGTHVSFNAVKIAPEHLERAIASKNLSDYIAHYGFLQYQDHMQILLELKQGSDIDKQQLMNQVVEGLQTHNVDFKAFIEKGDKPPEFIFYEPGMSPMAKQRQKYVHQKVQYIFYPNDEFLRSS